MNARTETGPTLGDAVTDVASMLAGLGMVTIVLFPFAVPAIALAAVAVVPLLALALLVGVVATVIAAPILAVRALRRRSEARRERVVDRDRAAASTGLSAAPSARVARP